MSKIFLAGSFATLLCASLAAQVTAPPATPSPAPSAPPISQPRTGGDTPQAPTSVAPPTANRVETKSDSITVQGCIQPSVNAVSATPDAVGTSGNSVSTATAFILTSVEQPKGTSGSSSSAAPIASTYQLDVEDSKLIPHVGHKVEISGTLVSADKAKSDAAKSGAGAAPAPTLKVDNVKMLAASCTP